MTRGSHGSEGVENEKGVAGLGVCSEILEYNLTSTSRGVLPIWQSIGTSLLPEFVGHAR